MNKRWTMMLVLGLVAVLGVGCGGKKAPEPTPDVAADPGAPKAAVVKTVKDLTALLGSSERWRKAGITYEQAIQTGGETMTSRVYQFGGSIRMDSEAEGVKTISVYKDNTLYTYDPDQKSGTQLKMTDASPEEAVGVSDPSATMVPDSIELQGTETLDGIPCVVFGVNSQMGQPMKCWADARYGIVIRMETTLEKQPYVLELKGVEVGTVDPQLFAIPEDVKMTEM